MCCGIRGDPAFGNLRLLHPVLGHLLDKIPVRRGFLPPSPGYPSFGNGLGKTPFSEIHLQALPSWGNDYSLVLAALGWDFGKGSQLYLLVGKIATQ